ncbi:efflux RND transporter periplasmic adaptor subunit [Thiomicrorhabdus indica]|uniref:efflux RND transporter periplasmic adaptor subunit n=1 Tax=Thiomicrorhabdus indica TaxID=2267253 RepID=UPI00102E07B7|nr:efflux RND transporter periplasmic adaptor subunit [Thiomicrorhabdus indica]
MIRSFFLGHHTSFFHTLFVVMVLFTSVPSPTLANNTKTFPVVVAPVIFESKTQPLEVLGTLRAKQSIELRANVSERLDKIFIRDGQTVTKGQLLFELSDQEELATLAKAKIVAAEAKRQFERARKLRGQGNITEATIDELKAIWKTAESEINIIQTQIDERLIKAPFNGTIGLIDVSVGDLVSSDTTLTTLDDSSNLFLDMDIPSQYRNDLKIGQAIKVYGPSPATLDSAYQTESKEVFAEIIAISPRLNPQTRLLQVRALIKKPKDLKSGMIIKSQIKLTPKAKLWIPNSAILMVGERKYVYRLKDANLAVSSHSYGVEKVEVQIGQRLHQFTEIMQGLTEGDILVSQGVIRMSPKSQVSIKAIEGQTPDDKLLTQTETQPDSSKTAE